MRNNNLEAVFIDRDGTIGGTGHFIHPREFRLYPFTLAALKLLKSRGIRIFAVTNQHRISRNQATIEEFMIQFKEYGFEDAFICPHGQHDGCACKKPEPGLLLEAAEKYNLNLERCAVIGDVGSTDMLLAAKLNCIKVLVKTGWGNESLGQYRDTWGSVEPDYIANDLLDAAEWITGYSN